jgi:hypothetical protein
VRKLIHARVLHVLVLVAGLGALAWALLAPIDQIRCHDQIMKPGDVCSYSSLNGADNGKTQTYEQRVATAKSARPVVAVVGVLVAGFGGLLLWSAVRRKDDDEADQLA